MSLWATVFARQFGEIGSLLSRSNKHSIETLRIEWLGFIGFIIVSYDV